MALTSALLAQAGTRPAAASTLPPRFTDSVVLSGLTAPTVMAFAPDGHIFVGQKNGVIKVFSSLTDTSPVTVADLSAEVDNFNGGLLGLAVPPDFPTDPHLYVLYSYDGDIGGPPGKYNDVCPTPPGSNTDGCTTSGRLSRLQLDTSTMTMVPGSEHLLVSGWCDQYPTHTVGTLFFGKDGDLYATGGDGASYLSVDYGQLGGTYAGDQANPCGDPPGGAGTALSPPTAEGGALRAQSVRRPDTEPTLLNGTVIRVDPATGDGVPGNPFYGDPNADANKQRIVAYGLRNPFRITQRPGTDELWIGDVGWGAWEEVDRVVSPAESTAPNFGWPCYEGDAVQPSYQAAGLTLCSTLTSSQVTAPYYAYSHTGCVVAYAGCPTGSASITGMAFYEGGAYPAAYDGALFFADHSRKEIWVMMPGSNGLPDPTKVASFVGADSTGAAAGHPVDLTIGPGGDLFYVDLEDGTVHRITYDNQPPTASLTASTAEGTAPLKVDFDASGSTDPEGRPLTYSWDLNGDGTYGDATGPTASHTYGVGVHQVSVKVTDNLGQTDTHGVTVTADNTAPRPVIDTPAAGTPWKVGDTIGLAGHATDDQDGALPGSALSWQVVEHHCDLSGTTCSTHVLPSPSQAASGSVQAPDCRYPCWLDVRLTATDFNGLSSTTSLRLDPTTVALRFRTSFANDVPAPLIVNGVHVTSPYTLTAVVGSTTRFSAPTWVWFGRSWYRFRSWSDGAARRQVVAAPGTPTRYTARYRAACPRWLPRTGASSGSCRS